MTLLSVTLAPNRTVISQAIDDPISVSAFDGVEIPAGSAINQLRALSALSLTESAALLALVDEQSAAWVEHHLRSNLNIKRYTLLPLLDGLPTEHTHISPENRFLTHSATGKSSVTVSNAANLILEQLAPMLREATALLLSGDLPSGIENDIYTRLGRLVRNQLTHIVIDSNSDVLRDSLSILPFLVSTEREELLKFHGIESIGELSVEAYVELAQELIRIGAHNVATTLDQDNWLLVSADGYVHLNAPHIEAISPIGCRDAWVAITMRKFATEGWSLEDAATFGTAAATAQLLNPIPGQFNPDDATLFAGRITTSGRKFGLGLTRPELSNQSTWQSVRVFARPNQDTRFNSTLLQTAAKPREDYFAITNNCIVIADGITHRAISGKYQLNSTSAAAAKLICRLMPRLIELHSADQEVEPALRFGLKACNSAIRQLNAHRSAAEIKASDLGGAIATVILRNGDDLHLLHLGDCRAMLVRDDQVIQLTRHQTERAESLADQWKQASVSKDEVSRRKRALRNPHESLTPPDGAFGVLTGEPQALAFAEYSKVNIGAASHLIICSDGFAALTEAEILALAKAELQPAEITRKLERAEHNSSTRSDDKTIIIVEL